MGIDLRGRRILVAEDNYILADEIARNLREKGAEVIGPAATVEAALALVRDHRHAITDAVLDVDLRGAGSYPIAEAALAMQARVIFVTGFDSPAIDDRWAELPRLQKPLDMGKLTALLA